MSIVSDTYGIALCTYNGEAYLNDQLNSISCQTKAPDAVLIVDDCSTDHSWAILESWQSKAKFPVTLVKNKVKLGVRKNFEKALSRLQTDVIFLCDQDDIWHKEKIQKFSEIFFHDRSVVLIHTNADLVDKAGRKLKTTFFASLEITQHERLLIENGAALKVLLRRNTVTGATAAIRQSLLDRSFPFPPGFLHDEWIALIASVTGKIAMIDDCLISYRQHDRNVVGAKKLSYIEKMRKSWWRINSPCPQNEARNFASRSKALIDRLKILENVSDREISLVNQSLVFYTSRSNLKDRLVPRFVDSLRHVWHLSYSKFSSTPISDFFRDLRNK